MVNLLGALLKKKKKIHSQGNTVWCKKLKTLDCNMATLG